MKGDHFRLQRWEEDGLRTVPSPHLDSPHFAISLSDFRELAAEIEEKVGHSEDTENPQV